MWIPSDLASEWSQVFGTSADVPSRGLQDGQHGRSAGEQTGQLLVRMLRNEPVCTNLQRPIELVGGTPSYLSDLGYETLAARLLAQPERAWPVDGGMTSVA